MTDYFLSRRLIELLEDYLRPKGYVFLRWSIRGDEVGSPVYEYVFLTPDRRQEVTTSITAHELSTTKHPTKTVAGVLGRRIVKRVEAADTSPPSPS